MRRSRGARRRPGWYGVRVPARDRPRDGRGEPLGRRAHPPPRRRPGCPDPAGWRRRPPAGPPRGRVGATGGRRPLLHRRRRRLRPPGRAPGGRPRVPARAALPRGPRPGADRGPLRPPLVRVLPHQRARRGSRGPPSGARAPRAGGPGVGGGRRRAALDVAALLVPGSRCRGRAVRRPRRRDPRTARSRTRAGHGVEQQGAAGHARGSSSRDPRLGPAGGRAGAVHRRPRRREPRAEQHRYGPALRLRPARGHRPAAPEPRHRA